jgi:hypothetical protein
MPIIINDFEIVVEPKPTSRDSQSGGTRQDGTSTSSLPVRPEDVEQMIRRLTQRSERLRAD